MVKLICLLLLLHVLFLILGSVLSQPMTKQSSRKQHTTTGNNSQEMDQSELDALIRIISHITSDQPPHPNPCKPGSTWPGIECKLGGGGDMKFHVTKLNFGSGHPNPPCDPTSTFPSDIFTLPYLQSVSFHQCFTHTKTTITFPSTTIHHHNNSLQQLSLRSNPSLTGQIPHQISSLTSLTILTLSQNKLTGTIPSQLTTSLTSLTRLDLSYNTLTGPIPNLTTLKSLLLLDLSYNAFTGHIPNTLSNLKFLQKLDLSCNQLNGPIPQQTLESLTSIIFLALSNNHFSGGKLPLQNLHNLQYLILDNNPLLGITLPSELSNFANLQEIRLGNTSLIGTIPVSFGKLKDLTTLSLENNKLYGEIPSGLSKLDRIYYLNLSGNDLQGVVPFEEVFLKRMERNLDLSRNPKLCIVKSEVGFGGNVSVCGEKSGDPKQQMVVVSSGFRRRREYWWCLVSHPWWTNRGLSSAVVMVIIFHVVMIM